MSAPRTLYDKIWDDHVVDQQEDGTCLLYIDRHLVHEVTSPQAFEGLRLTGVPTSSATAALAREAGIAVAELDGTRLDLTIDGADEVDAAFNLIKGGGGAHTREKVVAAAADRFVVIADGSKVVDALRPPIPLELLDYGVKAVLADLSEATLRDVPKSPDGGLIADFHGDVSDPEVRVV